MSRSATLKNGMASLEHTSVCRRVSTRLTMHVIDAVAGQEGSSRLGLRQGHQKPESLHQAPYLSIWWARGRVTG